MVRRKLDAGTRARLIAALDDALGRGLAALDAIAARRRDTGITEAEVVAYLRNFSFRVGPAEHRAIAEFTRRDRIPTA